MAEENLTIVDLDMASLDVSEQVKRFMTLKGMRRKYEVAEFFGVTPQAISSWYAKNEIPPKHQLILTKELLRASNPVA